MVLGLGVLRVDGDREGDRAVEAAARALATMDAHALVEADRLLAGEAQLLLPDLDLEILLLDAGQLGSDDEIVVLAQHVDQRKRSAAGRRATKPVTPAGTVQGLLQGDEGAKGIGKAGHVHHPPGKGQTSVHAGRSVGFIKDNPGTGRNIPDLSPKS